MILYVGNMLRPIGRVTFGGKSNHLSTLLIP